MFEIKKGDTVNCIKCGYEFVLDGETFKLTPFAEVVICPKCKHCADVHKYHMREKFVTSCD